MKKIKIINENKAITMPEVRKTVEMGILRFMVNRNDPYIYTTFFEDIDKPYLKGLLDKSKEDYNAALDQILVEKNRHKNQLTSNRKNMKKLKPNFELELDSKTRYSILSDNKSNISVLDSKYQNEFL